VLLKNITHLWEMLKSSSFSVSGVGSDEEDDVDVARDGEAVSSAARFIVMWLSISLTVWV